MPWTVPARLPLAYCVRVVGPYVSRSVPRPAIRNVVLGRAEENIAFIQETVGHSVDLTFHVPWNLNWGPEFIIAARSRDEWENAKAMRKAIELISNLFKTKECALNSLNRQYGDMDSRNSIQADAVDDDDWPLPVVIARRKRQKAEKKQEETTTEEAKEPVAKKAKKMSAERPEAGTAEEKQYQEWQQSVVKFKG